MCQYVCLQMHLYKDACGGGMRQICPESFCNRTSICWAGCPGVSPEAAAPPQHPPPVQLQLGKTNSERVLFTLLETGWIRAGDRKTCSLINGLSIWMTSWFGSFVGHISLEMLTVLSILNKSSGYICHCMCLFLFWCFVGFFVCVFFFTSGYLRWTVGNNPVGFLKSLFLILWRITYVSDPGPPCYWLLVIIKNEFEFMLHFYLSSFVLFKCIIICLTCFLCQDPPSSDSSCFLVATHVKHPKMSLKTETDSPNCPLPLC